MAADSDEAETQFEVRCSLLNCRPCYCDSNASWAMAVRESAAAPKGQRAREHVSILCDDCALQAFQVSDQAVRLARDGWFQPQEEPSGESKLRNPKVRGGRLQLASSYLDCILSNPLLVWSRHDHVWHDHVCSCPAAATSRCFEGTETCAQPLPRRPDQPCPGCMDMVGMMPTLFTAPVQDPGNEAPVIVAVKDLGEVDNDYFLIPVGIRDHESGLASSFPVENRLLPQGGPLFECYRAAQGDSRSRGLPHG